MTLVVIDWAVHPIPPLAVLLAGARVVVTDWLRPILPAELLPRITDALKDISSHPLFQAALDQLKTELSRETAGLGAAREKNEIWLTSRFADRSGARQVFGQFLAPTDPSFPAIVRENLIQHLGSTFNSKLDPKSLIALVGEEGSGKTWLVASTWLSLPDKPASLKRISSAACFWNSWRRRAIPWYSRVEHAWPRCMSSFIA